MHFNVMKVCTVVFHFALSLMTIFHQLSGTYFSKCLVTSFIQTPFIYTDISLVDFSPKWELLDNKWSINL